MNITQFDVRTSFLYGAIKEEIYMPQPIGFEDPNQARMVCRLQKALYGLRQSSRVWNHRFNLFLNAYNLISTSANGCMYCSTTIPRLIIIIFVDDGMAICVKNNCMDTILSYMEDLQDHHIISRGICRIPHS